VVVKKHMKKRRRKMKRRRMRMRRRVLVCGLNDDGAYHHCEIFWQKEVNRLGAVLKNTCAMMEGRQS